MNRKLGLFLIASFLSMQMFSFLHMAEHGFEEHEHEEGQTCEIYLFSEHAKYAGPTTAAIAESIDYITFRIVLPEQAALVSATHNLSFPRAPPHFS